VSADPNRRGVPVEFWLPCSPKNVAENGQPEALMPDLAGWTQAELDEALPGPWPEECFAGGHFHGLFADQPHQQQYKERLLKNAKTDVDRLPPAAKAAAEKLTFAGHVRAAKPAAFDWMKTT
jgi:hypothetical protein